MRKTVSVIMLALLLLGMSGMAFNVGTVKSASTNVLVNGDFETGTLDGWNVAGECNIASVHSGNYSAYVSDAKYDSSIDQTVMLPADSNFQFTGWIFPTEVGLLNDYACSSSITFEFYNQINMTWAFSVKYEWCGYLPTNTTDDLEIVLSFNASTWNCLSINLTNDILSYFNGIDLSQFVLNDVLIWYHYSNGSPGAFYVDDLNLSTSQTSPPTITASVSTYPNTLNLQSRAMWITFYIELPQGYNVTDINVSTIALNGTVQAEHTPTSIGDFNNDSIPYLMVTFNRTELVNLIVSENITFDNVTLSLAGQLQDGTQFEGTCTIGVSALMGDVNCDGKVDLQDLTMMAYAFRSQPGDPNWNDNAAFAQPWDVISLSDIITLANHYGQQYP